MPGRDIPGCLPHDTPSLTYLGAPPQREPTTPLFTPFYNAALRNYFTNLHTRGRGGPPILPAQRACNSKSSACTSMASSGSPGSSRVEHKVESDCISSKARGCSASIMDAHSHDHRRGLASPCPGVSSLGGTLGFDSPCPSITSHSSSSGSSPSSCICLPSSSEEELSIQARRWHIPSSMMQSASWGAHGTKFANATAILSSTQLRSLATPRVGIHSTSSLAGLYARTLPSNMRVWAAYR